MKPETHVLIEDSRWDRYKINFKKIVDETLCTLNLLGRNKFASDEISREVSILLTNDFEIRKLNKTYRKIDKATNVLSFETGDDELLGDIILSFDTIMREAGVDDIRPMKKHNSKNFANHTTHMVVHGMLHLLGYDHIKDQDAGLMEKLEIEILSRMGIGNPYQDSQKSKSPRKSIFCRPIARKPWLFVFGVLAAFGFVPFNFSLATIAGIGLAYLVFNNEIKCLCRLDNSKQCGRVRMFLRGWGDGAAFGAGYAVASFWWVLNSIFVVPELAAQFAIWTLPGIVGIAIAGAVIFGLPFALTKISRCASWRRTIIFAAAWTLVLWLREWALTGFPWNPVANIAMPYHTLANSMSLWGALGLTFILVGLSVAVASFMCAIIKNYKNKNKLFKTEYIWSATIFLGLMIIGCMYGAYNIKKSDRVPINKNPITFRIVQPAQTQEQKATGNRNALREQLQNNLENLIALSRTDAGRPIPDIVIWPETAYPYLVAGDEFPASAELGRVVIAGATTYSGGRFFNSMVVADTDGHIKKVYNKHHLVPFGEYAPLGGLMPSPGNLNAGTGAEVINLASVLNIEPEESLSSKTDINFAPAICYEIVFSDSLVPCHSDADFIINLTNDTWFGKTPGTYQHLDMTRRYAIESGLPVVRANYSGISAFVDASGRVVSSLPIGAAGVLDGTAGVGHMTVYRRIGRDWWMIIILASSLIALCRRREES